MLLAAEIDEHARTRVRMQGHTNELLNVWANEFKHGESIPECAARLLKERDEWRTKASTVPMLTLEPPEYVTRAEFDTLVEHVSQLVRDLIRP